MSWEEMCHFIAQGVINIDSGYNQIEVGSQVYKAMVAFCEYESIRPSESKKKGKQNEKR